MEQETVTITKEEHERLKRAERLLDALNSAGVDNWEGYSIAWEIFNNG